MNGLVTCLCPHDNIVNLETAARIRHKKTLPHTQVEDAWNVTSKSEFPGRFVRSARLRETTRAGNLLTKALYSTNLERIKILRESFPF